MVKRSSFVLGILAALSLTFLVVTATLPSKVPGTIAPQHPGLALAERHCSTCHLTPAPEQLPREAWPFVLDWMGNYLGFVNADGPFANIVNLQRIPEQPIVSGEEMQAIRNFFLANAPEGPLRSTDKQTPKGDLPLFTADERNILPVENAYVTLLKIDESEKRLFVGYGNENMLLVYDSSGVVRAGGEFNTQPVGVSLEADTIYVTLIGDLMTDEYNGQVVRLRPQEGRLEATRLVEGYHRTAHALFHDLNGNGLSDIIVSGFGDFDEGRFAWFENLGADQYKEHVLLHHAGALKAAIHDFDGNGLPDIITLVAQGRQELLLYLNEGDGKFKKVQLLQKFPGFGFHSFELADFTGDGLMDVLLVNGNNMEIPDPPLRDYHGLHLFLNKGNLTFEKAYFYPMPGAIGARIADFTNNGLLDIAAISMFPDWSADNPESFVFLEQTDPMQFIPRTHPAAAGGRWMTIDAGDLTGNGRPDLVLGGGGFLQGIPQQYQEGFLKRFNNLPPVLILRNEGPL